MLKPGTQCFEIVRFRNSRCSTDIRFLAHAMWAAASTMSLRYRSSRRIQKSPLFEHGSPDQRLQPVFRYQIYLSSEQASQIQHQSSVVNQVDLGVPQELDEASGYRYRSCHPVRRTRRPKATSRGTAGSVRQCSLIDGRIAEMAYAAHVIFFIMHDLSVVWGTWL